MLITGMVFGAGSASMEKEATSGQQETTAGYVGVEFPGSLFEPDTSGNGQEGRTSRLPKPAKRIEFGLDAGVSSSFGNLNSSRYRVNNNIGFNAGIYVRVYVFKNFYVQPAVYYYFTSYDFRDRVSSEKDKVNVHQMRIPLMAGYTVVNSKMFFLRLSTGPSVGFNLKVSDNDVGVTKSDTFRKTYWEWLVHAQARIAIVTVHGGFSGGMSKYLRGGEGRSHTWYVGLGFSI